MPTRWLGAWSNGANGSEWSWSIRLHGGGKTSVSSLGVWDKRNLPYDALQRGVLSPLSKTYPRKPPAGGGWRGEYVDDVLPDAPPPAGPPPTWPPPAGGRLHPIPRDGRQESIGGDVWRIFPGNHLSGAKSLGAPAVDRGQQLRSRP